jgi:1-deoxy-D-xylulose-5-phosphate reductoisomerase
MSAPTERLDLVRLGTLTFEAPDETRFPALRLAREAMQHGDTAPAFLNAANEEAVAAFLGRKIGFCDIARTVEAVLETAGKQGAMARASSLDDVLAADALARRLAQAHITRYQ